MSKVGRPPIEPTETDLRAIEKLSGLGSTLDEIALVLGWSPATLDRKKKDNPSVEEAFKRGKAIASKEMANRLWEIAMSNDDKGIPTKQSVIAAIFWMKAQAKWSERLTIETEATEINPVQIYLPDNGRH
jgi:hypothetical protein